MSISFALFFMLMCHNLSCQMQEDILSPFYNDESIDTRRKNKITKSIEIIMTQQPQNEYKVKKFHTKVNGEWLFGNVVVVHNPRTMVSVLEPLRTGGCHENLHATVVESAKQRKCYAAANAGFVRKRLGKCYGNVISDGRIVNILNSGLKNVNFGIRKDGSLVMGYLSDAFISESTKANPFLQLVTGVGWVLRNGRSYVNESLLFEECSAINIKNFFEAKSARTFLGINPLGQVFIIKIDGKTNQHGINLYDAVDALRSLGITNAMNLGAAGSATFVENQNNIGYPSNACNVGNMMSMCPANVSTILCVHEPDECMTYEDCSSYYVCMNGKCVCESGRFGSLCSLTGYFMKLNDWQLYYFVTGLTVVVAIMLIFNVCLFGLCLQHRYRFNDMTSKDRLRKYLQSNQLLLSTSSSGEDRNS